MTEYRIGTTADIPEGGKLAVTCGNTEIGVFRLNGQLHAWHNSCPHRQGPICQGRIIRRVLEPAEADRTVGMLQYAEDHSHIICPWHGYEFAIETGEHPGDPTVRLRRAQVKTENGEIVVRP